MEELPEPIPQASQALSIIKDVTGTTGQFLVNKRQCESLVRRLRGIGEVLERLELPVVNSRANSHEDHLMNYPGFDELLTILKQAKDLLSEYRDSNAVIRNVFCSTENREAFKEIHDNLDKLKSVFYLEDFEYASESTKSAALTADADKDVKELSADLEGLVHGSEPSNATAALTQIVETVKVVVSEKTSPQVAELPSYLNIDPGFVEVKDAVRTPEAKSDQEVKDGVLVRFARYLNCEFAVKEFKSGDANCPIRDELLKEVRSLMRLPHPHVVQLVAIAQDKERCLVLMELMDGDLRSFMEGRKGRLAAGERPFTRSEELSIISQIAKGMHYLHEQQYVHGELKCSNILVRRKGDVGHIDVKISDLRSSQKLLPAGAWDPERSKRHRPRWAAPEVKYYGDEAVAPTHELLKKGDTYSFGMVCYEVLTGMLPFQDVRGKELEKLIEAGDVKQKLPAELNEDLQGLIESCWAIDPNDRPTFAEICHLLDSIIRSLQSVGPSGTRKCTGNALARLARMFPKFPETALGALCSGREGKPVRIHNIDHVKGGSSAVQETDGDQLDEFVRIHPTKLTLERSIGKGGSGEVYEATWLGCKFAVKKPKRSVQVRALQSEMKLLMQLRHPCIVQLVGLSVTGASSCFMVMELMEGNLQTLMDERVKLKRKKLEAGARDDVVVPFDLGEAVYIIQRIARAMVFLHFRGVAHRDLKALNVLVPLYSDPIDVKIADFGISEFINQGSGRVKDGTTRWMAPELESAKSMELIDLMAADVFSFAVTCFEILTGKLPFLADRTNQQDFRSQIIEGHRPPLPFDLHPGLKKLVEDCWDEEPKKRPSFSRICQVLDKISEGLQCSGSS